MAHAVVTVVGLGKVGLPIACHLARSGYKVYGYDTNVELLEKLRCGENPLPWEAGTDATSVIPTENLDKALRDSRIAYVIVPTPSVGKSLSSEFVIQAIRSIRALSWNGLIIVGSTLDPRDTARVMDSGDALVYSPPLIRLGSVVKDMNEAKVGLLGSRDPVLAGMAIDFWGWKSRGTKIIESDPVTIAVAKLAINTTLSMRIGWANEIADVAETYAANVETVLEAVQSDPRIGSGYMTPGWPPSGPCLPRDLSMWSTLGDNPMSKALEQSHLETKNDMISRVAMLVKEMGHDKVAVLGITYNPAALDLTNSQGLCIAEGLMKLGVDVKIYDPAARMFGDSLIGWPIQGSIETAISDTTAVVVATRWPEFKTVDFGKRFVVNLVGRRFVV